MLWDIFCRVIDNYGDIGVCWRLACNLAARGQRVRLWVDDASALAWMASDPSGGRGDAIEVLPWDAAERSKDQPAEPKPVADVWVEAFGCELPPGFVSAQLALATSAGQKAPVWINLEYLSAEGYVESCHQLPSPVMSGPGAGLTKFFFYPGFTSSTGGLLREGDVLHRQSGFSATDRAQWLGQWGIDTPQARVVSLFCYEPQALAPLLEQLSHADEPTHLLIAAGRAQTAVRKISGNADALGPLQLHFLPYFDQTHFDRMLWSADLNFVRGEDSLVRAIWAGKPFVWQIYPQDDGAHASKLEAFLDCAGASAGARALSRRWNGLAATGDAAGIDSPLIDWAALPQWQRDAEALRQRLARQDDLATQLVRFVEKKR